MGTKPVDLKNKIFIPRYDSDPPEPPGLGPAMRAPIADRYRERQDKQKNPDLWSGTTVIGFRVGASWQFWYQTYASTPNSGTQNIIAVQRFHPQAVPVDDCEVRDAESKDQNAGCLAWKPPMSRRLRIASGSELLRSGMPSRINLGPQIRPPPSPPERGQFRQVFHSEATLPSVT